MEDDATCSLCMEVFTDPVSLPCGHGFCRACLKSVVDHKTKSGEDTSSDSAILPCPLCRLEVTLGPNGVDELQPNQDLLELMQRRAEVNGSAEAAPLCDMCESDNRKADHYCANCMTLYCAPCMAALHPPRGPLRRHRLMSLEQYLSEQTSNKADLKTTHGEADCNVASCKEHKQPLILHCGTCERLICTDCFSEHHDHIMQHVNTTYKKCKASLEAELDCCKSLKSRLETLRSELIATQKDIQTKTQEEYKQIDWNYERGLRSLQDWRESERRKVDEKRDTLTSESLSLLKSINLLMGETDSLLTSSADLLSENEALFLSNLKESKELLVRYVIVISGKRNPHSSRHIRDRPDPWFAVQQFAGASRPFVRALMVFQWSPHGLLAMALGQQFLRKPFTSDTTRSLGQKPLKCEAAHANVQYHRKDVLNRLQSHASESNIELEEKIIKATELRSALSRSDFRPYVLTILQGTPLKFTESHARDIIIGEDCLRVEDKPGKPARNTTVRTDGLITGTQYWEVTVNWGLSSPPTGRETRWHVCTVGVRQEGFNLSSPLGEDPPSYGLDIWYNRTSNGYRFDCSHQKKTEFTAKEHALLDKSETHRFGFFFQSPERTLTVIDMGKYARLHTFRGLDVSRPFVPAVMFGCEFFHRTISLPVDGSSNLADLFDIVKS